MGGEEEPTQPPAGETGEGQGQGLQKKQFVAGFMAKKARALKSEDFMLVNVQRGSVVGKGFSFIDQDGTDPIVMFDPDAADPISTVPPDRT